MIEFFDEDNPRKRRSYSFSQTAPLVGGVVGEGLCPAPPSRPKVMSTEGSRTVAAALAVVAPTAARLLQKQRSEDPGLVRSSVSTGQPSPSDEPQKQDDDQSDKGTYTIELENRNPEEEEARRMIDKVRYRREVWAQFRLTLLVLARHFYLCAGSTRDVQVSMRVNELFKNSRQISVGFHVE